MDEKSVVVALRELILSGELKPGEPVLEEATAERLGVSRTPIRNALPALAAEGLLNRRGTRGFSVRGFTRKDSIDGLEIRSVLEGLAAKRVALAGPTPELLADLQECLDILDAIFAKGSLTHEDELTYSMVNERFHAAIISAAESPVLQGQIARVDFIPFVAPSMIAFRSSDLVQTFKLLSYAHLQHHAIVEALVSRDAARAEFLFREHAFSQLNAMWTDTAETAQTPAVGGVASPSDDRDTAPTARRPAKSR